jgi:hypothetical protein
MPPVPFNRYYKLHCPVKTNKKTCFHNLCYVCLSNERAAENGTFSYKLTANLPLFVTEKAMVQDTIVIQKFEERMWKNISFESIFTGAKLRLS